MVSTLVRVAPGTGSGVAPPEPPTQRVYYHELMPRINAQILVVEREIEVHRCRSLKDCMLRMHVQWQALVAQVRQTRTVGQDLGEADVRPLSAAVARLIAESVQFLVRLSEVPEVMTKAQVVAHRAV